MVGLATMDCMKTFVFNNHTSELVFFLLFFRPGLPGTPGQPGLDGLPGAKVN